MEFKVSVCATEPPLDAAKVMQSIATNNSESLFELTENRSLRRWC